MTRLTGTLTRPKLSEPVHSDQDALPVAVLEGLGREAVVERLDQGARHVDLALGGRPAGLGQVERLGIDELVGKAHRVQDQAVSSGPDPRQVLAVVKHPAPDAEPLGTGERVVEQAIGVGAVLARPEVVGAVEVDGIDLGGPHELLELYEVERSPAAASISSWLSITYSPLRSS